MRDDPLTPDQSHVPCLSDSDDSFLEREPSSDLVGPSEISQECSDTSEVSKEVLKGGLDCPGNSDKSSQELSLELKQILTDLEKNSFRECVAQVLGKEIELNDSFPSKDYLSFSNSDSDMVEVSQQIDATRAVDETFVYDTSSEESIATSSVPVIERPIKKASPYEEEVARITPWREIFPPLYIHHRFPQRTLYWVSTAIKHRVLSFPLNTS